MDTQAMVPSNGSAMQRTQVDGVGLEGLEGLDQGDLIIPRFQIVQPTSAAAADGGATPGTFRSNLAGESFDSRQVVPLIISKGRVWFEPGAERPTCKSDDGIVPSRVIQNPPCATCCKKVNGRLEAVCPRAVWVSKEDPPPCRNIYNLLALDIEADATGLPFFLTAKGMSLKPVKRLASYLVTRRLSPFSVSMRMRLAKTKNAKGTFYVLDFDEFSKVDPPDTYREQFLQLRGYDIQKTYDAEDVVDDGFGGETDDEMLERQSKAF